MDRWGGGQNFLSRFSRKYDNIVGLNDMHFKYTYDVNYAF